MGYVHANHEDLQMLVNQRIWRVGPSPERLAESTLPSERLLEDMIIAKPEILSDLWMIIGQQEFTGFGGRIDLLAIAPDSSLVLIELKRDRSPREVVAQAIDYAAWVEALDAEAVFRIYSRFKPGADLARDFAARFGTKLDMEVFSQPASDCHCWRPTVANLVILRSIFIFKHDFTFSFEMRDWDSRKSNWHGETTRDGGHLPCSSLFALRGVARTISTFATPPQWARSSLV